MRRRERGGLQPQIPLVGARGVSGVRGNRLGEHHSHFPSEPLCATKTRAKNVWFWGGGNGGENTAMLSSRHGKFLCSGLSASAFVEKHFHQKRQSCCSSATNPEFTPQEFRAGTSKGWRRGAPR